MKHIKNYLTPILTPTLGQSWCFLVDIGLCFHKNTHLLHTLSLVVWEGMGIKVKYKREIKELDN